MPMLKLPTLFLLMIFSIFASDRSDLLTDVDAKNNIVGLTPDDMECIPPAYARVLHPGDKVAVLAGARESGLRSLTSNIYAINDNATQFPGIACLTGDIIGDFCNPDIFKNLAEAFDVVIVENPGQENIYKKKMYETAILLAKSQGRIIVTGYYDNEITDKRGREKFRAAYKINCSNKISFPGEQNTVLFNMYCQSFVFINILIKKLGLPFVPSFLPDPEGKRASKSGQIKRMNDLCSHNPESNLELATRIIESGVRLYNCWDQNMGDISFVGFHRHYYCVLKKKSSKPLPTIEPETTTTISSTPYY